MPWHPVSNCFKVEESCRGETTLLPVGELLSEHALDKINCSRYLYLPCTVDLNDAFARCDLTDGGPLEGPIFEISDANRPCHANISGPRRHQQRILPQIRKDRHKPRVHPRANNNNNNNIVVS